MPLQAVQNRSLADQVFAQLATEIVGGEYETGAPLPSERELSESFGVNRHVVREALKRLAQASLVKIAQGGHTRVLDYKRVGGLELLALFAEYASGHPDERLHWCSVLEMRGAMAADIVRLCALRASQQVRDELIGLSAQMAASADPQEVYTLEMRFWERVLDGADNLAYRLAFNSLIKSVLRVGTRARDLVVMEVRAADHRQVLAAAIARGDAEAAETDTRRRMRDSLLVLERLLGSPRSRAVTAAEPDSVTAPKRASGQARRSVVRRPGSR